MFSSTIRLYIGFSAVAETPFYKRHGSATNVSVLYLLLLISVLVSCRTKLTYPGNPPQILRFELKNLSNVGEVEEFTPIQKLLTSAPIEVGYRFMKKDSSLTWLKVRIWKGLPDRTYMTLTQCGHLMILNQENKPWKNSIPVPFVTHSSAFDRVIEEFTLPSRDTLLSGYGGWYNKNNDSLALNITFDYQG